MWEVIIITSDLEDLLDRRQLAVVAVSGGLLLLASITFLDSAWDSLSLLLPQYLYRQESISKKMRAEIQIQWQRVTVAKFVYRAFLVETCTV